MKRILALLLVLLIPATAFGATLKEDVGPIRYESNVETVRFGRYDQDNDPENGPEPIEWIVLEEKDGKRLCLPGTCWNGNASTRPTGTTTGKDAHSGRG